MEKVINAAVQYQDLLDLFALTNLNYVCTLEKDN